MHKPRALITGAAGQDGRFLAQLLLDKGYEVFSVPGPDPVDYLEWAARHSGNLHLIEADMQDASSLERVIEESSPAEVYNLAGISSVALSWQRPVLVAEVNAVGVVRFLEALHRLAPHARFCQASSADIFGMPTTFPQDESTPISPVSPYGASKAYAHFMTRSYRSVQGVFACNAMLFNHESPMRPETFVTRKVTLAAARIKLGLQGELKLGNLDAQRDWGYAGDYVRAMWLMLQAKQPDDYVVATGVAHSVRDLCEAAFSHVGLDYRKHVVVDPELFRPLEATRLLGNASKAREVLGWEPEVGFAEMIARMVDHDLELLQ